MNFAVEVRDQFLLVRVTGEVTLRSATGFRKYCAQMMSRGYRRFVVDMHNVSFLDSSGLGALLATTQTLRRKGGDLKLFALPQKIERLLRLAGISFLFDIAPSQAAAIAAFGH